MGHGDTQIAPAPNNQLRCFKEAAGEFVRGGEYHRLETLKRAALIAEAERLLVESSRLLETLRTSNGHVSLPVETPPA
jgi:hypothetical protein